MCFFSSLLTWKCMEHNRMWVYSIYISTSSSVIVIHVVVVVTSCNFLLSPTSGGESHSFPRGPIMCAVSVILAHDYCVLSSSCTLRMHEIYIPCRMWVMHACKHVLVTLWCMWLCMFVISCCIFFLPPQWVSPMHSFSHIPMMCAVPVIPAHDCCYFFPLHYNGDTWNITESE